MKINEAHSAFVPFTECEVSSITHPRETEQGPRFIVTRKIGQVSSNISSCELTTSDDPSTPRTQRRLDNLENRQKIKNSLLDIHIIPFMCGFFV